MEVFLIGGGREDEAAAAAAHGPFVQATAGGPVLCLATDDLDRWVGNLRLAGAEDVRPLPVGKMTTERLDGVAGVYVGGGLTPVYLQARRGLHLPEVPYCGFSAATRTSPKTSSRSSRCHASGGFPSPSTSTRRSGEP